MFTRRPIRSMLRKNPKIRSTVEPYTTEEISGAFEQIALALGSIHDIFEQVLGVDPKDEDMEFIKVAIQEIQEIT